MSPPSPQRSPLHRPHTQERPIGRPGPRCSRGPRWRRCSHKVLGRTITFHPITFEEQKQAMIDVGLPEAVAEDNATAVALMADGDCDYVTDDVPSDPRQAGPQLRTVRHRLRSGVLVSPSSRLGGGAHLSAQPFHDNQPRKGALVATTTHNDSRTAHLLELMTKGDNAFNARDWETVDNVHHPDMIAFIPGSAEPIYGSRGAPRGDAAIPPELPRHARQHARTRSSSEAETGSPSSPTPPGPSPAR